MKSKVEERGDTGYELLGLFSHLVVVLLVAVMVVVTVIRGATIWANMASTGPVNSYSWLWRFQMWSHFGNRHWLYGILLGLFFFSIHTVNIMHLQNLELTPTEYENKVFSNHSLYIYRVVGSVAANFTATVKARSCQEPAATQQQRRRRASRCNHLCDFYGCFPDTSKYMYHWRDHCIYTEGVSSRYWRWCVWSQTNFPKWRQQRRCDSMSEIWKLQECPLRKVRQFYDKSSDSTQRADSRNTLECHWQQACSKFTECSITRVDGVCRNSSRRHAIFELWGYPFYWHCRRHVNVG